MGTWVLVHCGPTILTIIRFIIINEHELKPTAYFLDDQSVVANGARNNFWGNTLRLHVSSIINLIIASDRSADDNLFCRLDNLKISYRPISQPISEH